MHDDYETHDIVLRDIATPDDGRCPDDLTRGCLVVTYRVTNEANKTYTEARAVSSRLPVECLVLFDDGRVPVADLSADERAWLQAESGAHSNEIDFAGTEAGPEVAA